MRLRNREIGETVVMKRGGERRPEETFFREQLQGNLPSSFLEESSDQAQEQGKILLSYRFFSIGGKFYTMWFCWIHWCETKNVEETSYYLRPQGLTQTTAETVIRRHGQLPAAVSGLREKACIINTKYREHPRNLHSATFINGISCQQEILL